MIPTPASGTQQDTDQQLKSVKLPRTSKSSRSRGPEEPQWGSATAIWGHWEDGVFDYALK